MVALGIFYIKMVCDVSMYVARVKLIQDHQKNLPKFIVVVVFIFLSPFYWGQKQIDIK